MLRSGVEREEEREKEREREVDESGNKSWHIKREMK